MIKWSGKATNGIWRRKEEAENFLELYNLCVKNETINVFDGDPWDEAILEKNNKTWDDFSDEQGELDFEKFQKWSESEATDLTDKEIWLLISGQIGNAYYQTFEIRDDDAYREIDGNDFDDSGKFKY